MTQQNTEATLHMMQARLDLSELNAWIGERRIDDQSRAIHRLMTETLGEGAPRQFRLLRQRGRPHATIYGYTRQGIENLVCNHQAFATPQQERAMPAASIVCKTMPQIWPDGAKVSFDVLCRPIRQRGRLESGPESPGWEKR